MVITVVTFGWEAEAEGVGDTVTWEGYEDFKEVVAAEDMSQTIKWCPDLIKFAAM